MPTSQFSLFSKATENLNINANVAYQTLQTTALDTAVLDAPDTPITRESFKPQLHGISYDLGSYSQAIAARLDLVQKYAKVLEALAGKDNTASVDSAATDFASSLSGLGQATGRISPQTANDAGALADAIGRWATYGERMRSLESTLDKGQTALESLANEINTDTAKLHEYVDLMIMNYLLHANKNRPPYQTWARFQFDTNVNAQLAKYDQLTKALDALNAAAKQLPAANKELRLSLQGGNLSLSNLKNFAQQVRQLRSFYYTLPID